MVPAASLGRAGASLSPTLPQATPAVAASPLPGIVGYQVLGELGRGGMGVVYKAQHLTLKRLVALKMVLSGAQAGSVELARFRAEAEAVARLHHPNIVQIYEVGEQDGRPYCALEYVAGGSLAQKLAGKPLTPATAATLVAALAEGVQHAHEHGIVHRDLKPANVLLSGGKDAGAGTSKDTRSAAALTASSWSAVPKITDFGLAKALDTPDGPTKSGTILGTPSYMAPEQAMGKKHEIGPATDVYSLGAILYECLTGRPPFKAETSLDTMLQVASQDPVPPRQINNQVPHDLDTICLKCLRKEPSKRYGSARGLADDLGRFLRNEPIRARPVGPVERAFKWAKRRPAWTAALVLVLLLPPLTGALVWKWRQGRPIQIAQVEAAPIINADQQIRYAQQISQADQEHIEGKFNHAQQILEECSPALRGWEWHYLHRLCNWGMRRTLTDVGGPVRQVAFSRNGRLAVIADSPGVQIRDAGSGKLLVKLSEGHGPVNAVAFSPDGKQLAAVGNERMLRVYDSSSGQELAGRDHGDPLLCVAFSPDGKWLAAGGGAPGKAGILWLWNATPGQAPARKCTFHKQQVTAVAFSADSSWFASMGGGEIHGWFTAGGDVPYSGSERYHRLSFVPRSPAVGMLSYQGVDLWWPAQQTKTGYSDPPQRRPRIGDLKVEPPLDDQPDRRSGSMIFDAAYNADETMLALAGGWTNQGKVRVYRGNGLNASVLLFGHADRVGSVCFAPDQPVLATGSHDGTVRIWDPTIRRFDAPFASATTPVLMHEPLTAAHPGMAFSPDSQRLATLESDPLTLALWDLQTGQKTVCPRLTDKGWLQGPHFCADGRVAAVTGEGTRTVCIWDGTTGAKVGTFSDQPVSAGTLAPLHQGFLLASSLPDRPIKGFLEKPVPGIQLIDPMSGQKRSVGMESFWLRFPILSPNGERLAAISKEGVLNLWDTGNGQVLLTSPGRELPRFSNDSRHLLRDVPQQGLQIWDAQTGQPAALHLPSKPPRGPVQFAPDGNLLAWPVDKGEILLWNAGTGRPVASIRCHGNPVGDLVFSVDGRRLFTVSTEDAIVKVWDTSTGQEMCSLHYARGGLGKLLLSPDGRRLALRNTGGTFVWDATPMSPEVSRAAAK